MSADSGKERRDPKGRAYVVLEYLRRWRNDRGAMADLRCALSPPRVSRAWPLLGRIGGIGDPVVETVAGMFAYHPQEARAGNMGTTCRALYGAVDGPDTRFRRLLACEDRAEICSHLRGVVLAARAKEVPINYEELFADIIYWGMQVKARWAAEYWSAPEEAGEEILATESQ
jgi:CRISPR system Cascade subunit CasB